MSLFQLEAPFEPAGDQPQAIDALSAGVANGEHFQTLLGVTGSGKTYTVAQVIARSERPVLIISHNKTLAAQLYGEFKRFFPHNAVEYFVSYYDYYQPEAYIPQTDVYIEKDAAINEDIERLRLAATSHILDRRDVIVIASVSCIYGIGSPEHFEAMAVPIEVGVSYDQRRLLSDLIAIQYNRNDVALTPGTFRVSGDVIEIFPAYSEQVTRLEFFGDELERISEIHSVTGEELETFPAIRIFPARHFVAPQNDLLHASQKIVEELEERLTLLKAENKLLEAQRLESRTRYDMEMLQELGYCKGIENYSRHIAGLPEGIPPASLIDYFPSDFLMVVDESHITLPQVRGMFNGDRARKTTLVEHGFRLPSALDNRPLRFPEFLERINQAIFLSATPGPFELENGPKPVEQIVRPTGLVDPPIEVRPATGQVMDLLGEVKTRVESKERVLITTITKRLAEDLADYVDKAGYRCQYLHSEIDTLDRVRILRHLREGDFDVLVGVNLLREGLDLPEVSLVAILDADKQGFLRSATSLIQIVGRTARNVNGSVILYGEKTTDAMQQTIDETGRRREAQLAHNEKHGITPRTIVKAVDTSLEELVAAYGDEEGGIRRVLRAGESSDENDTREDIFALEAEMLKAAEELRFEDAAELRDLVDELNRKQGRKSSPSRQPLKAKTKARAKHRKKRAERDSD